eukprot:4445074-Amphidinium_carterae.2
MKRKCIANVCSKLPCADRIFMEGLLWSDAHAVHSISHPGRSLAIIKHVHSKSKNIQRPFSCAP